MADPVAETEGGQSGELESLLEHLRSSRGFDFTGYKRPSLERRIRKRIDALGLERYADYQDHLEVNPDEFTELFDTILINVTGFFRDPPSWQYLASDVIPKVIESAPAGDPIRVWSAGCASGEEAYSVAMLLAEALGVPEFRRRVKIYATDVDEDALTTARLAVYPRDALKDLPEGFLERYWERNSKGLAFRGDMRRSVIFGRNDLVQDAPISRIDLLISRNVLMYFTPETQAGILRRFSFSLNSTGYLFLGKSEMLLTHSDLFTPHDLQTRVFTKVPQTGIRERMAFVGSGTRYGDGDEDSTHRYALLREGAADISPLAQVVLDSGGFLAFASQAARALFRLGAADVGRPIQDLELSYRPIDLRTGLARARETGGVVNVGRMEWSENGEEPARLFEVQITPLLGDREENVGASITFTDVTDYARLTDRHDESSRQLETAYEELQSTVEELETTNEELQSTNEELETTNEELQSTNEELETMNEELQSTNDELEAMNDEQSHRSVQLDRLNLFLEGILGNLGVGVVVVDQDRTVQLWNESATDLWGLRGDEVDGKPFLELDIGLPVDQLTDPIEATLAGTSNGTSVTLDAVNRRGKPFRCTVRVLSLARPTGDRYGVILLMSTPDGDVPAEETGAV